MTTEANVQELLEQERKFWNAMKEKDASAAGGMTGDACIIVGAQGVSVIDGEKMAKLTETGTWDLQRFTLNEESAKVRMIGPDVAIVAYTVDERVDVDGETISLQAHDSSVWVRDDGKWQCALHTESPAGDPFGRDGHDGA